MAVLNEKNVPYDIDYIDLRNKPDWFLKISPTGRVPVIQTETGEALFESAVINEFLDESHAPHFMGATPLDRAYDRMWCDFTTGLYGDVHRLYGAENEEDAHKALAGLQSRLARLEAEIDGPLFNGDGFSLVDATAAPPFMRIGWVEQIAPSLDIFAGTPKAKAWKEALVARPSVQNSVLPNLFDIFQAGLQSRGTWLGQRVPA